LSSVTDILNKTEQQIRETESPLQPRGDAVDTFVYWCRSVSKTWARRIFFRASVVDRAAVRFTGCGWI
jgi:hypothetical protein